MTLPAPYYMDESVTLYQGDNRELLPLLGQVDHVVTDPPYLLDFGNCITAGPRKLGNVPRHRGMDYAAFDIEDLTDIAPLLAAAARRWLLVWSDMESTHLWRQHLEVAGMRHVRTGIWLRTNPTPQFTGDRPAVPCEPVTICHARVPRLRWNGGGRAARWDHAQRHGTTSEGGNGHPTPKPLALMIDIIRDFTDPGEVILDCFAGSGTTGLAARMEGRRAILIEREERYCEVAARRLERMPRERDGQLAMFGGDRG